MSEPKFTPGPWEVTPYGEPDLCEVDQSADDGVCVCHGVVGRPNARLIAAAPDLYAACRAFVELFRSSDMSPEDECHELYCEVEAALKLADEGGA